VIYDWARLGLADNKMGAGATPSITSQGEKENDKITMMS